MGKQKSHRRKLHKENPTGLQSVQEFDKELNAELGEGDREKILQDVYNDVSSKFYRCNIYMCINYTLFNKIKLTELIRINKIYQKDLSLLNIFFSRYSRVISKKNYLLCKYWPQCLVILLWQSKSLRMELQK